MAILLLKLQPTMKDLPRILLLLLLLVCAGLGLHSSEFSSAQAVLSTEDLVHVEATDLLRLAEFVEWPLQAPNPALRTFNFCVLGQNPFGKSLEDVVLGHSISERPTMIVRGSRLGDMGHCDVVFVSSSEQKEVPKILREVRGKSILTVGQTADFAASGGIIQLMRTREGVELAINVDAAKKAGLTIRAPLLALANIVRDEAMGSKNLR